MSIQTNLHGQDYDLSEVVRIVNPVQAKKYIKHKVYPIDLYAGVDCENKDVLIFVFLRSETEELYQLWNKRELI